MKNCSLILLLLVSCFKCIAFVKPNSLFSDNMVLQRGVFVPVWGTANDGEKVTIEFNGQKEYSVAKDGKWMVKLKPMKANSKPSTMRITGENVININNILVGEVWVCSGQSNMEMSISSAWPKHIVNWQEETAVANYPEIRQYQIAKKSSDTLVGDANSKWVVCDTTSVKGFSAVGYFFARDLYRSLKVPIGILFTSWGGTPAEYWTPHDALEAVPELKGITENFQRSIKDYPSAFEKYNKSKDVILQKWMTDSAFASQNHFPIPPKPAAPWKPIGNVGCLYNAMINPIIPFAIKGFTWYQGEANRKDPTRYQFLFPTLINAWRKNWNDSDLPFLFVQLAPYKEINPEIREAQFLALDKVPNTAMVVTTDCGDSDVIHPGLKQPVGFRLSLAARALAYKEKIEYSGPFYKGFIVKDNAVEIYFTHTSKGLLAKDGDLRGFVIAGEDKKFVSAKAVIKGDKVIVTNGSISKPIAVRYGWENVPDVNLYNSEGLPASPFRTDIH